MRKVTLKLRDGCFEGNKSSSYYGDNKDASPKHITWERVDQGSQADVYTDVCLPEACNDSTKSIAWLVEPPGLGRKHYKWIVEHFNSFDYVLSYIDDVLEMDNEKCLFVPACGSWIDPSYYGMNKKTKLVSMIYSYKTALPGHIMRHEIAKLGIKEIDLFGSGVDGVYRTKHDSHLPYMYTVVVEGVNHKNYFGEKLTDALCTGCVPIYCGCENVGDFFNTDGMIIFDNINELSEIVSRLSGVDYNSRISAIQENIDLAQKYRCAEDWIFENYGEKLFNA